MPLTHATIYVAPMIEQRGSPRITPPQPTDTLQRHRSVSLCGLLRPAVGLVLLASAERRRARCVRFHVQPTVNAAGSLTVPRAEVKQTKECALRAAA